MARTTKACPAEEPVQASALCDDGDIDPDIAEARKRAGIALRKMTIASTMVYAGLGSRASARARETGATKPAKKRPAAQRAEVPEADRPALPVAPIPVRDMPNKRKRTRTQSQLIGRLVDTIDGQLDLIDAIMRDPHRGESGPSDAERHARAVAALARVTVELRKELEAGRRRRADDDSAAGRDQSADPGRLRDPDRPRDLDELRERLSRRLDVRLASGPALSVGDDAAGGNRLPE